VRVDGILHKSRVFLDPAGEGRCPEIGNALDHFGMTEVSVVLTLLISAPCNKMRFALAEGQACLRGTQAARPLSDRRLGHRR
jgi:hypothetical protein